MGKTIKGKNKVAAKKAALKRKIARKCKACVILITALALFTGCSTSDSAQPAKSQTQNNSFEDCTIIIAAKVRMPVKGTNEVIEADGGNLPTVELLTQTQSLESSGTETYSPTATQTPTTDVKPDLDVRYNDAMKSGSDALAAFMNTLLPTSAVLVKSYTDDPSKSGTFQVTKTDGSTATVKCENGACSVCADGSCSKTN